MARTRADLMADYLAQLLAQSGGELEIQRGALAAQFGCAPSQVNYVLATRFTLAHGYVLESRPGAKGYIRIRIVHDGEWVSLASAVLQASGDGPLEVLSQAQADHVVGTLRQVGLITGREEALLLAVIDRQALRIALPERDRLRARLVKAALRALSVGTPPQAGRREPHGV